ncbi:MAG TPA: amidohydrolase family protein [Bryobacteraceae bacterium]|nr:amidohydrolase family protein [Bryobacteraceae bacterium]
MPRLAILLTISSLCAMAQARNYSIVVAGRTAGHETDTFSSDGSVRVTYSYNDRGRGPEIQGRYVFDRDGMTVSAELMGQDYNHTPVDERFAAGQWKSRKESGESKSGGWYVAADGPAAQIGWLARAMLQAGTISMRLLPGGEATIQRGASMEVKGQRVTMYSIGGLDFTPQSVWLDDHNEFFAGSGEFAAILEGFEDALPNLEAAVREAGEKRFHELALRFGHKPAHSLAIRHVRVFDAETATAHDDQVVIVNGNRIQSVSKDHPVNTPGVEVIDGTGKTLLPGLFDMHAHFEAYEGILNIACGVTNVRDLGNDMNRLLRWKQQMDANEMIGPRVVLAGVMDGRGPYTAPTDVLVDTEAEAKAAIEKYKAAGYIQIKIYSSIKPELVGYIVRVAHENGMRVSGHVPAGMIADQFVDAGVDEFQHINFFFLNFWPEEAVKTNTRARLTVPAERAASLDPNSPEVQKFIAKLKAKQIVVDPTLGVFEAEYTARPGVVSPSYAAIVDHLPVLLRRAAFRGGLPVEGDRDRIHRASFQAMLDMTARLYRAGVPLVIGTDGIEGLMLHRELELWVKAGIPPEKVLQIATIGAARVACADGERGSIAAGKLADLGLFDGDPVREISDIRKPRIIIKDGVVYRSEDLFHAIGMTP